MSEIDDINVQPSVGMFTAFHSCWCATCTNL